MRPHSYCSHISLAATFLFFSSTQAIFFLWPDARWASLYAAVSDVSGAPDFRLLQPITEGFCLEAWTQATPLLDRLLHALGIMACYEASAAADAVDIRCSGSANAYIMVFVKASMQAAPQGAAEALLQDAFVNGGNTPTSAMLLFATQQCSASARDDVISSLQLPGGSAARQALCHLTWPDLLRTLLLVRDMRAAMAPHMAPAGGGALGQPWAAPTTALPTPA